MKWKKAIAQAATELSENGISDAELNAELLAAYIVGGWKRGDIRPFLETHQTEEDETKFAQAVLRRKASEPLQYIIGETEFFGLRLFTTPAALIPRPDTEILVEEVLKYAPASDSRILDIGTGTGAIALAIASRLKQAQCIGIDISTAARELAERNRARLGLGNVEFRCIDVLGDVSSLGEFDIIVSNPPYISVDELAKLDDEVKNFEPLVALTDHADGFTFFRTIINHCRMLLKPNGMLLFECSYDQARMIKKMLEDAGFIGTAIVNDLAGIERVVLGMKRAERKPQT